MFLQPWKGESTTESWVELSVTVLKPDLGGRTWLRSLFPKQVSKLG